MADGIKLLKLRRQVGADASDDDLLLMYLDDAKQAILNHLYPMEEKEDCLLPKCYEGRQVEIAVYLYNKRGAEGETAHSENGINRTYGSASIPPEMLSDIVPYGSVIS